MVTIKADSKSKTSEPHRLMELEGLRGIAAVMVVIFHVLVILYPAMFYGLGHEFAPIQHMQFEDNIFGSPLTVFASGAFAVCIFFILSGFVLSIGFFQQKRADIIRMLAAKRYIRLMLPALASTLLVWAILFFGLNSGKIHAEVLTSAGSSSSQWGFMPNLFDAFYQGAVSIFTTVIGAKLYNPVLWTMLYEFWGSFLVFATVLLFGQSRHRWIVYVVLLIATFGSWYTGFVIGMIFADLYVARPSFYILKKQFIGWLLLVVGVLLGGYPIANSGSSFYKYVTIPNLAVEANLIIHLTLGAALVMYGTIAIPQLSALLKKPKISILGRYTFSLYLVHLPILFTVYLSLFAWFAPAVGYNQAAVLSILVTIPVIIAVTWLFERYVDAPSIRLSSKVAGRFVGHKNHTTGHIS